jgi:ribosomal protein L37E
MRCQGCGTASFRISRLRLRDSFGLVRLLYPVRCRRCGERTYVFLPQAMKIRYADTIRRRERHRRRQNPQGSAAAPKEARTRQNEN